MYWGALHDGILLSYIILSEIKYDFFPALGYKYLIRGSLPFNIVVKFAQIMCQYSRKEMCTISKAYG